MPFCIVFCIIVNGKAALGKSCNRRPGFYGNFLCAAIGRRVWLSLGFGGAGVTSSGCEEERCQGGGRFAGWRGRTSCEPPSHECCFEISRQQVYFGCAFAAGFVFGPRLAAFSLGFHPAGRRHNVNGIFSAAIGLHRPEQAAASEIGSFWFF